MLDRVSPTAQPELPGSDLTRDTACEARENNAPRAQSRALAIRIASALAAIVILLAPALWNRFSLLEYDTGGYLARWFEGYLVPSRSKIGRASCRERV